MSFKNCLTIILGVAIFSCHVEITIADPLDDYKSYLNNLSQEERVYIKSELAKDKAEYSRQLVKLDHEIVVSEPVASDNAPAASDNAISNGDAPTCKRIGPRGGPYKIECKENFLVIEKLLNEKKNIEATVKNTKHAKALYSDNSEARLPAYNLDSKSKHLTWRLDTENSLDILKELKEKELKTKKDIKIAIKNTEQAQSALNGEDSDDPFELIKQLEVIKLRSRPMFVVCGGAPWIPDDKTKRFDYLATYFNKIQNASKSVGELRINHKKGEQWKLVKAGIASVVAIDSTHIITNAHVIRNLNIAYQNNGNWFIRSKLLLDAVFPDEYQQCDKRISEKIIQVTGIRKLDENIDFVVLETKTHDIPVMEIQKSINNLINGDEIIVMGYPSEPEEEDTFLSGTEINKLYSAPDGIAPVPALRLSIGKIIPKDNSETQLFRHDATTWGASSGSLVMRLRDGAFIGLHQGGMKSRTEGFGFNYAIPIVDIANALK
jgi:hypothetical protein